MKVDYQGRNFHIDERLREHADHKLAKLEKFLEEPVEIRVILDQEKHRCIADLHVSHRLGVLQATEETTDGSMQEAFNLALDKVESQAVRSRKKRVEKRRRADRDRDGHHRWPVEVLEGASVGGGETPRIIETTHISIKPMTIDEAAIALDVSDQEPVVFRDAATDRLSVLYKRKDGHYGLIAPEL